MRNSAKTLFLFIATIQQATVVKFKILYFFNAPYWPVIAQGLDYDVIDWSDYQREKNITISKHNVCVNNSDLKTPYLRRILEVHISLSGKNG